MRAPSGPTGKYTGCFLQTRVSQRRFPNSDAVSIPGESKAESFNVNRVVTANLIGAYSPQIRNYLHSLDYEDYLIDTRKTTCRSGLSAGESNEICMYTSDANKRLARKKTQRVRPATYVHR